MPLTVLAHATPIIVAPRKMESAHSRIRKKRYSPHNCKHCFNQCRFLFLKLKKWISRLPAWENESISERGNVAKNLKEKIRANEEKLNKLVSVFLDGDIEREMYSQRKDLLMRRKSRVCSNQKTNFGQQRKNWVEPLRSFVLSLKQAADLEKTSNHLEWKKFFQKIGSNPEIKDKTVSIRWGELWDFTASAVGGKGFGENQSAILASAKSLHILNSEQVTSVPKEGLEPSPGVSQTGF